MPDTLRFKGDAGDDTQTATVGVRGLKQNRGAADENKDVGGAATAGTSPDAGRAAPAGMASCAAGPLPAA